MAGNEIETMPALDARLASGRSLRGLRLQDLDLASREPILLQHSDFRGTVVLGGSLTPALETHLRRHGAVLFPANGDAPVNVYRPRLYSPSDLYAGLDKGYESTPDARAYHWSLDARSQHDAYATLLRAIHDDSISDALTEASLGLRPVGVMGGHATQRGSSQYTGAARLGHRLASAGLTVVTGGGPGAMEAANLGAIAGDRLDEAAEKLARVPSFRPSVTAWARLALDVRASFEPRKALTSIGIPTWFYGHEPPNVFADGIAKYFSNALREDVLLALCTAGIVVLPGAAGTVQEIFQTATRLYYSDRPGPPLVLVGRQLWETTLPAWPLLQELARGRAMDGRVHLVDSTAEAADILAG